MASLQADLDGRDSSLVNKALRLVDELDFAWMFVDKVDGIVTKGND